MEDMRRRARIRWGEGRRTGVGEERERVECG
jgi:hypothetical protein